MSPTARTAFILEMMLREIYLGLLNSFYKVKSIPYMHLISFHLCSYSFRTWMMCSCLLSLSIKRMTSKRCTSAHFDLLTRALRFTNLSVREMLSKRKGSPARQTFTWKLSALATQMAGNRLPLVIQLQFFTQVLMITTVHKHLS